MGSREWVNFNPFYILVDNVLEINGSPLVAAPFTFRRVLPHSLRGLDPPFAY
jgi:hypothetical protein